jgi:protein subunit release factor B
VEERQEAKRQEAKRQEAKRQEAKREVEERQEAKREEAKREDEKARTIGRGAQIGSMPGSTRLQQMIVDKPRPIFSTISLPIMEPGDG